MKKNKEQFVETLEISHSLWTRVKSDYKVWYNRGLNKDYDTDYVKQVVCSEHLTRASSFLLDNHEDYNLPLFYKLRVKSKNYELELNYACQFSYKRNEVYANLELSKWLNK